MTFDRFHVAAKLSEAVNEVRRAEVKTRPELCRYQPPGVLELRTGLDLGAANLVDRFAELGGHMEPVEGHRLCSADAHRSRR